MSSPTVTTIKNKYTALELLLNERARRVWAAKEAEAIGWGGVALVSEATNLSKTTIIRAMKELRQPRLTERKLQGRLRRWGGGRKPTTIKDAGVLEALESLVDPTSRGDPQSPLRWTLKSTRNLAEELNRSGHSLSAMTVARLLAQLGFSLQANRKTHEGKSHPDRDAQFRHIIAKTKEFQSQNLPVISVDAKKKELVGDFKNGGKEWQPKGDPDKTKMHDFLNKKAGETKGIPYGVYDILANNGWVSVGIDHNTAEFAVATIKQWWQQMGSTAYQGAKQLLITADGGGSNASRSRLWKRCLQQLADETKIGISVCHFPPGTSKWNKIEHRMFSHITQNWRGSPLRSLEIMVNLIANTKTRKGLSIKAGVDPATYEIGKKISDEELNGLNINRDAFHGDWNYKILPR